MLQLHIWPAESKMIVSCQPETAFQDFGESLLQLPK
jgi:hypothetical protein